MSSDRQVIVISGGSRGLGQAIVADLLRAGHAVATFSRSETPFIQACQQGEHAESFHWEQIDSTDFEQVRQFVREVDDRFDGIDVVINNAGVGVDGILSTMPDAEVRRGITVNLEAAIQLTRACLKSMLRQQSGCVINVTSVNGIRGFSGVSVYSATKAGLDGLTRSLAREVGPNGIRVNSVAPGYFESDMTSELTDRQKAWIVRQTPLRRLGSVDDLVGVVRFLISPAARFFTGQTVVVDGGLTC
jgi:3-oxoacyl-[acyl-carrier protein] reductase